MSAIITAVFKATIGLVVNKGRDKAAEMLKDGDVTDQQFRGLIVREIDDIKSKLDGLSRKDLLASISFFKEGIELLYEAFDVIRSRSERGADSVQAACAEALSLTEGMRNLELTNLDESAARKLANAKKRFERARERATDAYSNQGLTTSDRILAMQYRVMATILETIDNPADAMVLCKVCIEELNGLPAVQNSFEVQIKTGIKAVRGLFNKEERRKIISGVCHVNRVIYDVTRTVSRKGPLELEWPTVDMGEEKVDPLRDGIVTKALRQQGIEHCCVSWSFGQEGEEEHRVNIPVGIATNSSGQFIVAEFRNRVNVFDTCGKFLKHFSLPTEAVSRELKIHDVATDMNDNIYVLATPKSEIKKSWAVYEFNKTGDLHHKIPLRERGEVNEIGLNSKLSVTDSGKLLVLRDLGLPFVSLEIYETDGPFVCSIGEELLRKAGDITAVSDGRVMVLDGSYDSNPCVQIFSEYGEHLNKFDLQGYYTTYSRRRIAFHRASERVIVAGEEHEKELLHVQIYTKDGEFVRSTQIHQKGLDYIQGITVTTGGRIIVLPGISVCAVLVI